MSEATAAQAAPEKQCLRCGGQTLLPAHLEHPMTFCMDQETHHGRVHLSLKALLCQDCGHVEFWASDAALLAGRRTLEPVTLQEEDF